MGLPGWRRATTTPGTANATRASSTSHPSDTSPAGQARGMYSTVSANVAAPRATAVLAGAGSDAAWAMSGPAAPGPHKPGGGPDPGLNARAARKGLFFGSAVDDTQMRGDPALLTRIVADCGMVVGESSFKWEALLAQPGHYTYGRADALLQAAARMSAVDEADILSPEAVAEEIAAMRAERRARASR